MTKDEPRIPEDRFFQSSTKRCAVEGKVAKLTGDQIILGPSCTVQIVQHVRGWLIFPYGLDGPDGCDAAWISTPDGFLLARMLGGQP